MGHIERKRRDQENIRASIINAAINLAKSEGWSAVTIRKIAEAIEYTPPIVYEYFKNKDDLIHEIIIYGFQKLRQMGSEHLLKTTNPKEKLLALSLVHWDFSYEHRELYQLMFSLERPLPNDEAEKGVQFLKDIFNRISGQTGKDLDILIFNWICLLNGTISMIMQFEKPEHPLEEKFALSPRELFMRFMERFVNSLDKQT